MVTKGPQHGLPMSYIKREKLETKETNMLTVVTFGSWGIINKFACLFFSYFS